MTYIQELILFGTQKHIMAESPIIESPRPRISSFSEKYLKPCYVGWLNSPSVVRLNEQRHRIHTPESCGQYRQLLTDASIWHYGLLLRLIQMKDMLAILVP